MSDRFVAIDLFAGAGGLSTALTPDELTSSHTRVHWWLAENVELHAVNHWEPAITTHEQNHPWAEHHHAKIEELHPPDVVPPGDVNLADAHSVGPDGEQFCEDCYERWRQSRADD